MDFIVATSGRTGSNFLQRLLILNGFGDANEYFHPSLFGFREAIDEGRSTQDWLIEQRKKHTHGGNFGIKLMATHLQNMFKHMEPRVERPVDVPAQLLPDARYIYLYREDLFRQAISNWRARTSGKYIKRSNAPKTKIQTQSSEPIRFDPKEVEKDIRYIMNSNTLWEAVFASYDLKPMLLSYEQLTGSPRESFEEITNFLDLQSEKELIVQVDIERQADEQTERFLVEAERHFAGRFDRIYAPAMNHQPVE